MEACAITRRNLCPRLGSGDALAPLRQSSLIEAVRIIIRYFSHLNGPSIAHEVNKQFRPESFHQFDVTLECRPTRRDLIMVLAGKYEILGPQTNHHTTVRVFAHGGFGHVHGLGKFDTLRTDEDKRGVLAERTFVQVHAG